MVRTFFVAILICMGISLGFSTISYGIALTQFIYFFVLILMRPYKKALDNVGVIILEFTTLYALCLPLAMRYTSVPELN